MTKINDQRIKVYVGTYRKYNDGNLFGAWIDLEDFSSLEEFLEHCRDLHKDEYDPEFMFQDTENLHDKYYGECEIKSEVWDYLLPELNNNSLEKISAYLNNSDDIELRDLDDACVGEFNSDEEFAEEFYADEVKDIPPYIYLDWEAIAHDLMHSHYKENNFYFRYL